MIWKRSDVSRRSAWTKADIRRARQTPLQPVLEHLGYRLQPLPSGNYLVTGLAPEIVVKDHYWVCPDTGAAGNAIDFLVRVRKTPFHDALRLLLAEATWPEASSPASILMMPTGRKTSRAKDPGCQHGRNGG